MPQSSEGKMNKVRSVGLPILKPVRVVMLSTYIPRKCGIATFTKDLANSINSLNPERVVEIIAMDNNGEESLDYPWEVKKVVRQHVQEDYLKAADYINNSIIDTLVVQHEYGIFGGKDGEYILDFVKRLKKPFVVILHTVLQSPSDNQRRVLQELSKKAKCLITMIPVATDILTSVYEIEEEKIEIIPHGTPDFALIFDNSRLKSPIGFKDKIVMSSVNLLDPNKGFENVIKAIPDIKKKYPNFVYLLIGQTHPGVIKKFGESYREGLIQLTKDLNIEENVVLINKYIPLEDLIKYILASDFYITPYKNMQQISSGALSYAIAAGKICMSTPYRYALENLSGGRGYLVQPEDSKDIAAAVLHALEHPKQIELIREKCYNSGRKMIWPRVAFLYLEKLVSFIPKSRRNTLVGRPNLDYIRFMTDAKGMLEHSAPDKIKYEEGYAVDDNARAMIVAILHKKYKLAEKYLNFVVSAEEEGKVHCDLSYEGQWVDEPDLGDFFGRAFWAACFAYRYGTTPLKNKSSELIIKLYPNLKNLKSLRPKASCLIGLCLLTEKDGSSLSLDLKQTQKMLANSLIDAYRMNSDVDWHWFEEILSYDNARLPQSLLMYSKIENDETAKEIGLSSLNFVIDNTYDIKDSCFKFIGSDGWFKKDGEKSTNNEQPIEAGATAEALVTAYLLTENHYYLQMAQIAFSWYFGNNSLRFPMVNFQKGSIYDGIGDMFQDEGVNLNQGAESVLSYHLGYFALELAINHCKDREINNNFHALHTSMRHIKSKRRFKFNLKSLLSFGMR
ncbi:MAG: group 1 glycosyl transferase [Candidatus Daviesbacteria bacterium GW2011_GWA2_38_24]|uniref:Group 1 glycosyl transferase n=1 Tax=Candidatus Daviesbacteria bacterium GW2011_GWA2_38_24 TaxID=1618422 RepID=A0A0G0JHB1_9BACT|nr:MAG: group 1 glycosyl transferase [Candidatus Daviesbacteria bacterium GW2011_GWA2_38_24]KKQ80935.1 MAG: group 1 glycosyl transferase [Candidatus Daviesbacteria bacterium GW2011_GWA1_38_7]